MLFHFAIGILHNNRNKKIRDTYVGILKVNKCERWFRKYASDDFDLSDSVRSKRPAEFDSTELAEFSLGC